MTQLRQEPEDLNNCQVEMKQDGADICKSGWKAQQAHAWPRANRREEHTPSAATAMLRRGPEAMRTRERVSSKRPCQRCCWEALGGPLCRWLTFPFVKWAVVISHSPAAIVSLMLPS